MKNHPAALFLALALTLTCSAGHAKGGSGHDSAGKKGETVGWYLITEISVEDPLSGEGYKATNPAVLGMLPESEVGFDSHDIPAFASLARSRIAAVFVHDDWEAAAGEYHSDYRDPSPHDSWLFTVNSSVPGGVVTVAWDGLYDVIQQAEGYGARRNSRSDTLEQLHLVDLVTLEVIPALQGGRLNTYAFTLAPGETSRQLRWVLGPLKGKYFDGDEGAMRYIAQQRKALKQAEKDAAKSSADGGDKQAGKPHPVFGLPPGR